MKNTSPKYAINTTDLYKITRGFLITLAGAVITFASEVYLNIDYSVAFKGHTVDLSLVVIPLIGSALEAGRRWLADYSSR